MLGVEMLEDRRVLSATADIVFLVDESGSTGNQNDWLADIVTPLDAELQAAGITNNRYGLAGFSDSDNDQYAHTHLVDPLDESNLLNPGSGGGDGDTFFGTALQLSTVAGNVVEGGGGDSGEDGWDAIEHAVAEYDFRDGATILFVLIQNSAGRTEIINDTLTQLGMLGALDSSNALFNAIAEAPFDPTLGSPVLGVEADEADGAANGQHIAHVVTSAAASDVLQISFDGSNIGPSGLVASGKSVVIGTNVSPGIGPSEFGYSAAAAPFNFEDISMTGTAVLQSQDDAAEELDATELVGFTFDFFGTQYDRVFFSTNGLITFESADPAFSNNDWTTSPPSQPSIAALWDDTVTSNSGAAVYWEVRDAGQANERLIIQWDSVAYISDSDPIDVITYQAVLLADGSIQLNYLDIDSDADASAQTGGMSATIGIGTNQLPLETGTAVFIDGTHAITSTSGVEDEYVRLAWDTGGAAWNIDIVEQFAQGSPSQTAELEAFNSVFIDSLTQQILKQKVFGNVFGDGVPVVELNVGGPTVGSYLSDSSVAPPGTTTIPTLDAIDVNSNSIPTNAVESIFKTARVASTGNDMNWNFDESAIPNGSYVVELFFAEIDPNVSSSSSREFDIVIEGVTLLDNYDIYDDRTKIPLAPNSEGELLVSAAGGVADTDPPAGTVKRFRVDVADGNGMQIDLVRQIGDPLLSGLRILGEVSADFDSDGDVDGADFLTWQRGIGTGTTREEGDANFDGQVDGDDLAVWQLQFGSGGGPIGSADFDCDGDVDGADFLTWQRGVGSSDIAYFHEGDADFDRDVDGDDLAIWQLQFGTSGAMAVGFDADFDDDGDVSSQDYLVLQQNLGMVSASIDDGDANGDGNVDGMDVLAYELEYDRAHPETDGSDSSAPVYAAASLDPGEILVSTLEDEIDDDYSLGDLSLREALIIASQTSSIADAIVFAVNGTILLNNSLGSLVVNSSLTISGPSADLLTISGNDQTRVFAIAPGVAATFEGLTVTGGYVAGGQHGGGLSNAGDLTLQRVEIVDNFAGGHGGGVYSAGNGSALRIYDSTIAYNQAGWGAGVRVGLTGSMAAEIVGSTVHHNTANNGVGNGTGGGVYFSGSGGPTAYVTNSTLSSNSALLYSGGLRAHQGAVVAVTNSTITQNSAGITGGGFASVGGSSTTFTNSIVVENSSVNTNYNDGEGSFLGGTVYNLIGRVNGVTHHSGPFGLDPLADNGGPTLTHAILSTSPALNAGNNAAATGLAFDQRGLSRTVGGIVDIGAVEYQTILVSTLIDENDGNYSTGDLSLRESIALAKSSTGSDTIAFAGGLAGTIVLNDSLEIDAGFLGDLSIVGPGREQLTIDANATQNHVFALSSDPSSTIQSLLISDLTMTGATVAAVGSVGATGSLSVNLDRLDIIDNVGGGISLVHGGNLSLTTSEVAGNQGFGVRFHQGGLLAIDGSALIENDGVAIDLSSIFDARIVNSTISGNTSAQAAGGMLLNFAIVDIVNSTITHNSGMTTGGFYLSYGVVDFDNSIVAGNFGSTGASDLVGQNYWSFEGSEYNLVGVDQTASFPTGTGNQLGVSVASLRLSELGNHGGETRTHSLLAGSIAIDAGNDALAVDASSNPLLVDQRGRNRFVNAVDIGAVEQDLLGDFDGSGSVSGGDFLLWQSTVGSTVDLRADGDGNGKIESHDLSIWSDHYGNTPNGTPLSAEYSIVVVSSQEDEQDGDHRVGSLSLREALAEAYARSGHDKLVFRHALQGQTIELDSGIGELSINSDLTLVGPGADMLTISGDDTTRIFNVSSGATVTLQDLRLSDGYVMGYGGAISNSGDLTLNRVAIEDNYSLAGGGIYSKSATLTILNSTVAENYANYVGGGIYADSTTLSLVNTTVSTNTTSYGGGGVYSYGGSAEILHSTVTQNRATTTSGGGGIYIGNGQAVLDHSIVADNYIGTGSTEHNISGALDLALSTFNLIGTGGGAGGLTHGVNGNLVDIANPGLASLDNYGGRTRTHALLLGSLAIDAGDLSIAGSPSTDQRGYARIDDGDGNEEDRIDSGAFELAADEYFGSLGV